MENECQSQEKYKEMSVWQSMGYMIQTIWKADKGCVLYTFYKNCSEIVFDAFFFVYMTQTIYTYIDEKASYGQLAQLVIFFCVLHIIIHLVSAGHAYYIRLKTPKVYHYIFDRVITKATHIELTRYEQPDFYDKFSRALDECLNKAMDGLANLTEALGRILSILCTLGIIAAVDPLLILFIFPPVIGSLLCGNKQNKEHYELRKDETLDRRTAEYVKRVFYEKKYASEIRLYHIKNILFRKHQESYKSRYQINVVRRKKIAFYQFLDSVVFFGLTYFSSYVYITFILKANGGSKLGAYIAMLSAIGFVSWQVREAIKKGIESGKYCLYMNNLKEFLEYESAQEMTGNRPIETALGDIEFEHVSFTYEGAQYPVINDLSLFIKKGERVALVGENGAGKTTLMKLLMGLYPVTQGEIQVSGCNINDYDMKDYQNHFGTVFQDLQIFSLPLAENVLMKSPESEEEKELVVDALIKAQFKNNLECLKNGIETMITKEFDDQGFVCSGGQAQKIALARVFAKNPDIVVLDEPSSALDPIAEYNMYHNMMQVSEGKTVFFISHRLSSARIADKIYFLEHGQVKESGTHDELINLDGKYAEMFHLQAKNYQDNGRMEEALHA